MQNRTLKVAILAALTVILVLSFAGVALADQTWSDLPDTVTAKYGVTDNQVASISDGFPGGLWKPYQSVTRAQFTKMAVEAFKVDKVNPATASYTDVAKGSVYYEYIEGAKAVGMINGATAFNPNNAITREQALAIIVRYVAKVNGYNLATMYTAAEVDGLLAHFGDKASIGSALKTEVAFAYDFGITVGDAYGNVAPQTNLTRIQGAAMLIRAQLKIPPADWTAAKIELVTADKTENLIGQNHTATFKVTTADGHPAVGVLVDFDTLQGGPFEVGNISAEAGMTNSFGEVTTTLNSSEPGTQRVSAAVAGVPAVVTTKYWLVLDEVYITDVARAAENNVGEAHTWGARVVVFGPGPRSTSVQDWYNAISTDPFVPTDIQWYDGVDEGDGWYDFNMAQVATSQQIQFFGLEGYGWDYAFEKHLLAMYDEKPRTLAGIDVNWSIVNWMSADLSDVSVGTSEDILVWDDADGEYVSGNFGPVSGGNYVYLYRSGGWGTVTSVKFGNSSAAWEDEGSYLYVRVPKVSLAKTVDVIVINDGAPVDLGEYQYIDTLISHVSVGNITAVDGATITPAKTAKGVTNADGLSTIKIESTVTGKTNVQAIANYAGNPYPNKLFNHSTFGGDYGAWPHYLDWDAQPAPFATAIKTWIPHVIGEENPPITPQYAVNNTGEVETFTLTLKDTYGNVIPGYTVQWWIQGVGLFKANDTGSTYVGTGEQNKQLDMTDALGQAKVMVKSLTPGQTILHVKVMDKYGLPYHEWNVVKQWYSIDEVVFLPTTDADGDVVPDVNLVNNPHTFTVKVSGAKQVFTVYDINGNGLSDDQVYVGNRADMKAAEGVTMGLDGSESEKGPGLDVPAGVPFMPRSEADAGIWYVRTADITLAAGEYWADKADDDGDNDARDGVKELWFGLAGKTVYFFNNIGNLDEGVNSNTPNRTALNGDDYPDYVGTITAPAGTPPQAVTDANGLATVTINSTVKGYQWVFAVADYTDNPQVGNPLLPDDAYAGWNQLRWDVAQKLWVPDFTTPSYKVFAQGAGGPIVDGVQYVNIVNEDWLGYLSQQTNPITETTTNLGSFLEQTPTGTNPNFDTLAVSVFDQFGNALEGYKVTWQLVDQGTHEVGSQDTWLPFAHFENPDYDNELGSGGEQAGFGDLNPNIDANPIWGAPLFLTGPARTTDPRDDDYAWGYTLNGQINGVETLANAAHVDLVLDETFADLEDHWGAGEDVASIVNVKIYSPTVAGNGTVTYTLWKDFEVTKIWVNDTPEPTSIVLTAANTASPSAWLSTLTTSQTSVYLRARVLDQFGNAYVSAGSIANLKVQVPGALGGPATSPFDWTTGTDTQGYTNALLVPPANTLLVPGNTYQIRAWIDTDGSDTINTAVGFGPEVRSNLVPVTVNP